MKPTFLIFALSFTLASCGTEARAKIIPTQYIPAVFVYDGLVLDLGRRIEGVAGSPRDVVDCSTSSMACVRGGAVFELVTPKLCSGISAGRFEAGGVNTEVLRKEEGDAAQQKLPPHSPPSAIWLLASAGRQSTVFLYTREGVVGIYYDISGSVNLSEIARNKGIQGLRAVDSRDDGYYFRKTTFDAWGACQGSLSIDP